MPTLAEIGKAAFAFRPMTQEEADKNARTETMTFVLDYFFSKFISATRYGAPQVPPSALGDRFKILSAATGSGKGSVGFELYLRFFDAQHKNIVVLQPTVTTTLAIPQDILSVPKYKADFQMGRNVGYQTRDFAQKPPRGVIFMTTMTLGQILRSLTDVEFMHKYGFILVDEAHLRKVELDLVVCMLKQLIARNVANPECPFAIAMSGTMPMEKYANYFGVDKRDVISVSGQTYKKTEHFLPADSKDFVAETVATIVKIHTNEASDRPEAGDIIVFVSSGGPGKEITKGVQAAVEGLANKLIVTNVDSTAFRTGSSEYFNVLRPLAKSIVYDREGKKFIPTRRLIIGTPAMETGLTISSAKYVIDTGFVYAVEFNPVYAVIIETAKPVAQSMAIQRFGRVGRKFPGDYYGMYTKAAFDRMTPIQEPDIFTNDISAMVLNLVVAGTMPADWNRQMFGWPSPAQSFKIADLDLLDMPSVDSMSHALEKLFILGFIDGHCRATAMGCAATRFHHVSALESVRMIFEGFVSGANVDDLITIAAILEAKPTMLINDSKKKGPVYDPASFPVFGAESHEAELLCRQLYLSCDVIDLLLVYYAIKDQMRQLVDIGAEVMSGGASSTSRTTIAGFRKWMEDRGLVYDKWMSMINIRDNILMTCISIGLDPFANSLGARRHKYNLPELLRGSLVTGVAEVRKLKSAMYHGYRLSTASWSASAMKYVHDWNHIGLDLKSINPTKPIGASWMKSARPKQIMVFQVVVKLPRDSANGLFTFGCRLASAVDGFVEVDPTFITS